MGRAGPAGTTAALLLPVTLGATAAALARLAAAEAARLWAARAHLGDLAFDDLVLAGAVVVLATAAGWLGLTLALAVTAHTLHRGPGALHRLVAAVTPRLCRRLVAGLLGGACGTAALAVPAGVPAAAAADHARALPAARPPAVCAGRPPCLPLPDRPAAGRPAGTRAAPRPAARRAPVLVRRGDTLWAIAARHLPARAGDADVAAAWPAWFAANRDRIGPDPDLIRPGTHLRVPAGARRPPLPRSPG
jgi:resuscitation-promoting factor RpfA